MVALGFKPFSSFHFPNAAFDTELISSTRPAADLMFESIATSIQRRAIAVVLTGKGQDGAKGIQHIKAMGGRTIAQNQATAKFFGMPRAAI